MTAVSTAWDSRTLGFAIIYHARRPRLTEVDVGLRLLSWPSLRNFAASSAGY
jgi:hypothetical protein